MNARTTKLALVLAASATFGTFAVAAPPAAAPPRLAPTAQPLRLPPGLRAAAQPTSRGFLSPAELSRAANLYATSVKKKITPTSGGGGGQVMSLAQQPGGARLELLSPQQVVLEAGEPQAWFKSVIAPVFDPAKPHVSLTFPVEARKVYVIDCPIAGGPRPLYRVTFRQRAGELSTPEPRLAAPVTYAPPRDGTLEVELQGTIPDGEDYGWRFTSCRVTAFDYE